MTFPIRKKSTVLYIFTLFFFVLMNADASAQIITNTSDTSEFYYYRMRVKAMTRYIDTDVFKHKYLLERGTMKIKLLDYNGALNDFNAAIEMKNADPDGYVSRGFLYLDYEEFELALLDLNTAIQLDSSYTLAYMNKGRALTELKRFQEAIVNYSTAIKIAPSATDFNSYMYRGQTYRQLEEYELALQDFHKAIDLYPAFLEAYEERGVTRLILNDYEGSFSDYNQAIALGSIHPGAFKNRAVLHIELKSDHKAAIEDYTRAIQLNPNDATTYRYRAESLQQAGDIDGACSDLYVAKELGDEQAAALIKVHCRKYDKLKK
jgi:tetratricopeptide (TPR) repeat protein